MLKRLVLVLLLVSLPACSKPSGDGGSAAVKTPSLQERAWASVREGALLVDVRTQEEFDAGHLEGALLIPVDEIDSRASELGDDKSRAIVLYCRTGNRSGQAKRALEERGYTNVMNAGGYERMRRVQ
ncbi:MAG TPA: rhodanese-like domain-containing protein [Candidatus Eisenbacteria bacterium]|nr:rhodanese-like domain-containing protein [Candidatus Eisenbacteria bacterium]